MFANPPTTNIIGLSGRMARRCSRGWRSATPTRYQPQFQQSQQSQNTTTELAPPPSVVGAIRHLNLHEYASMELLREHGIRTPRGYLVSDPEEARAVFTERFARDDRAEPGFHRAYLKAQVLAGGRKSGVFDNGFEGGVRLVRSPEEVEDFAGKMLGHKLLLLSKGGGNGRNGNGNGRNGGDASGDDPSMGGLPCEKVLLVERQRLRRELYVSILMDRNSQGPILIGSALFGGKSITDIARFRPDSIFTEHIHIEDGLEMDQCERMAENLGLEPNTEAFHQAAAIMSNLYSMFVGCDCTMAEINPLGETPEGDMVAVDAKVQLDDNAAFRQPEIFAKRDRSQQVDPREARAASEGIDYVGLDGSIGCMVNGAGLAMATMDLIHSNGGATANFLDVGGGADQGRVQTALSILEGDPGVRVILVNIFGGLMRCDVIANGILEVSREIGIRTPMVLRLQGTNYEEAKTLIANNNNNNKNSNNIRLVDGLDEATALAVAIAAETITTGQTQDEREHEHKHGQRHADLDDDDPLSIAAFVGETAMGEGAAEELVAASREERSGIPRFEGFSL